MKRIFLGLLLFGQAAAQTVPAPLTLPVPGMNGPLAWPAQPPRVDLGPLGTVYGDAAVTGLGLLQSDRTAGDHDTQADFSNAQLFVQKIDGLVQFYAQLGFYSIPALGTAYAPQDSSHTVPNLYGWLPQAFLKIAPSANFSIEAGKLPTLIGAESTFTFENPTIERGLLWNQEPSVSRGVQVNATVGAVAASVSLNDGYYSDRYTWLSGSVAWTINSTNTLTFAAGGNVGRSGRATLATPLAQNNSTIGDLIYTYNAAPWTITPYVQYSRVPAATSLGFLRAADSYGAALLVTYAFSPRFDLAGRVEWLGTDGKQGAANLLYGVGSSAFSFTLTPTVIVGRFFVRGEGSVVASSAHAFGPDGTARSQVRGLLEAGVLF